jgi:hypothetical protein
VAEYNRLSGRNDGTSWIKVAHALGRGSIRREWNVIRHDRRVLGNSTAARARRIILGDPGSAAENGTDGIGRVIGARFGSKEGPGATIQRSPIR